jgi:predicted nucleic-acid-binding protein
VTASLDANVLLRHFTGQPPDLASRATQYLSTASPRSLLLFDVQLGEVVYVLESFYQHSRSGIAAIVHATLGLPAIVLEREQRIRRTVNLYDNRGMDWPDAYLVAGTEEEGLADIVSFDRFDAKLVGLAVERAEPS